MAVFECEEMYDHNQFRTDRSLVHLMYKSDKIGGVHRWL